MLGRTIAHLMEFNSFIHLLMKGFSSCAVRRMEGCIVAIGASAATDFSITVRTGEPSIQHYLLKTFAVSLLEIADKRIISFPIWETVFFKSF